jgi:RNA polymerase sigma-70 factor, ECF subfamily
MDEFKSALIETLPHLRAIAHLIARHHATAEDLVQDTMVQALANRHQFKPGTNLKGWLIVILRNRFINQVRKQGWKTEVGIDQLDQARAIEGGQEVAVEIDEFRVAFHQLPPLHREALILVGASGHSYEEAADIAGCPTGTMKSRVSRARMELTKRLYSSEPATSCLPKTS